MIANDITNAPEQKQLDKDNLSFEEALRELEKIVSQLEDGSVALDSAIELYSRGTFLKNYCEEKLVEAKLKVEQIVVAQDGTINLTSG